MIGFPAGYLMKTGIYAVKARSQRARRLVSGKGVKTPISNILKSLTLSRPLALDLCITRKCMYCCRPLTVHSYHVSPISCTERVARHWALRLGKGLLSSCSQNQISSPTGLNRTSKNSKHYFLTSNFRHWLRQRCTFLSASSVLDLSSICPSETPSGKVCPRTAVAATDVGWAADTCRRASVCSTAPAASVPTYVFRAAWAAALAAVKASSRNLAEAACRHRQLQPRERRCLNRCLHTLPI